MAMMINIALPKGRLGDKVYDKFVAAGYECEAMKRRTANSYSKTMKRA